MEESVKKYESPLNRAALLPLATLGNINILSTQVLGTENRNRSFIGGLRGLIPA